MLINISKGGITETYCHYQFDWCDYDSFFNLKMRQRPLREVNNLDKIFNKMQQEYVRKLVENE